MKIVSDEFAAVLDQIRDASRTLNAAGDAATEQIEALEKRLLDTDPGVTAWGPQILAEDTEHPDDEGGTSQSVQRRVFVGFGRGKKKWAFLVREELWGKKRPRDSEWTVPITQEVRALRKAERDLRILSLPHLRAVLDTVLEELRRRAAALEPSAPEKKAAAEPEDPAETIPTQSKPIDEQDSASQA